VAGKNCYRFYSRAMDQAVERRVQLEQDLRRCLDRGELASPYQTDLHLERRQHLRRRGAAALAAPAPGHRCRIRYSSKLPSKAG